MVLQRGTAGKAEKQYWQDEELKGEKNSRLVMNSIEKHNLKTIKNPENMKYILRTGKKLYTKFGIFF